MPGLRDTASDHLVILVVDDDPMFRNRLCRAFRDRDCEAHEAETAEETFSLARSVSPDLVLLDSPAEHIAYRLGRNPVAAVFVAGELVYVRPDATWRIARR